MKRCPECERLGIEHDPNSGIERCLWRDCLWINHNNIDLDDYWKNIKRPPMYEKFKRAL